MRANDGNRTRVASLEDWGSAIELRSRGPVGPGRRPGRVRADDSIVADASRPAATRAASFEGADPPAARAGPGPPGTHRPRPGSTRRGGPDGPVGVTGLEPATSCSQSRRAANCATPRLRRTRAGALRAPSRCSPSGGRAVAPPVRAQQKATARRRPGPGADGAALPVPPPRVDAARTGRRAGRHRRLVHRLLRATFVRRRSRGECGPIRPAGLAARPWATPLARGRRA